MKSSALSLFQKGESGHTEAIEARKVVRVLIVEDDPFSQRMFSHIVNSCGMNTKITVTEDFGSALKFINEGSEIHLFIIDLFLGVGRTGVDLYNAVSTLYPNCNVIMTSVLDRARFEALLDGVQAPPFFLQKPFHPEVCRAVIENLLKNRPKL